MSWLDKILPSRIRAKREGKASVPEGLWHKCSNCETVIYRAEYEKNLNVCPKCNHHGRISARKRADIIFPLASLVGAPLCEAKPLESQSVNFDSIKLLLTENVFALKINKNKQQTAFLIFIKMFLYLSL